MSLVLRLRKVFVELEIKTNIFLPYLKFIAYQGPYLSAKSAAHSTV